MAYIRMVSKIRAVLIKLHGRVPRDESGWSVFNQMWHAAKPIKPKWIRTVMKPRQYRRASGLNI